MPPSARTDGTWPSSPALVLGDINISDDIFVHDQETGETIRVSLSSTGEQANNYSRQPSISGDGRHIAFLSTDLVSETSDDDTGSTIYMHTTSYIYSGILQPINADGSSIFKIGRDNTVPVEFQLKDAAGNFIGSATATISLAKISDSIQGTVTESLYRGAATSGNTFLYDSMNNEYYFNLATSGLTKGTWRIDIALDDGTSKQATISLR